jgi:phosphatidylethanolamine/phosphatidyl-N-methylethanolamine N-methyltransferase
MHEQFRLRFFREFLRHPREVASILPSSRFLEQRIVEVAGLAWGGTIVELGPGTGGTTRAILRAMPEDARLLCVEINPRLCACLRRIQDDRLIAYSGNAEQIEEALSAFRLDTPDVVVSGIPLSALSRVSASRILKAISLALAPGGRFVTYQVSRRVQDLSRPFFPLAHVATVLFNVPPVQIYRWRKPVAAGTHLVRVKCWSERT